MRKEYYISHKEIILEKAKENRKNNPTKQKEKDRKYYLLHKEEKLIKYKEYYHRNISRMRSKGREYYQNNKDKMKVYNKKSRVENRNKFLDMYGRICNCCGEMQVEFLTMEHKLGQIGEKRKESGDTGYRIAVKEYRPDLYETLCMNCNFAKAKYGYCPHNPPPIESFYASE